MAITKNESVRVRFAPSPTGHLHIGSLRTALFNLLYARHTGGSFLVRIEDTDLPRSKKEYVDSILQSLKWISIEPDEPVVFQSDRSQKYNDVIEHLVKNRHVYKCFCSQDDLKKRKEGLEAKGAYRGYDGRCRSVDQSQEGPYVIRFKVPNDIEKVVVSDLIRGEIAFDREQIEDFVIARSDGSPTYNFVVTVDDADMKISHVIRGEDLLSSTPKQILLYKACGYSVPKFAHIPLILSPKGGRLSKRDGATSVSEYTKNGYLSDALVNYLARLGWAHGDQEVFSMQELIEYFSIEGVVKNGAAFDIEKLNWLNGLYIRELSAKKILELIEKDVDSNFLSSCNKFDKETVLSLIELYKDRVKTLKDFVEIICSFESLPQDYSTSGMQKWVNEGTEEIVEKMVIKLSEIDAFYKEEVSESLRDISKEQGVKFAYVAQPTRLALTGTVESPGVFDLLVTIGKEESIFRLKTFLDFMRSKKQ